MAPETDGKRLVTEDFSLPQSDGTGDDIRRVGVVGPCADFRRRIVRCTGPGGRGGRGGAAGSIRLWMNGKRETFLSWSVSRKDCPSRYQASLLRKVRETAEELSADGAGDSIALPQELGERHSRSWEDLRCRERGNGRGRGDYRRLCRIFPTLLFCGKRDQEISSGNLGAGISPSFIDKLVLLLDRRSAPSFPAMDSIPAADYEKQAESEKVGPLAAEIAAIGRKVREMNASVTKEWKELSARTGINEIMRFSTIIEDNLHKGTVLAEKLEVEGNLLREREKKSVQEKMRMIDTKLTLPMILMLFSLVLVTVAPAMMQM